MCKGYLNDMLFDDNQVVVFLTFLRKEIFAIEEVVGGEFAIESGEFFLVQAHTAPLGEFAHFAL